MENRDSGLLQLRPTLDLAPAAHPTEQFQNETLRPILKLQHDLLISICKQQFIKRKNVFFTLKPDQQRRYIQEQISRDRSFHQLLFGLVIGHFTATEFAFFVEHESEIRKRLTQLIIQRIQSQLTQQ